MGGPSVVVTCLWRRLAENGKIIESWEAETVYQEAAWTREALPPKGNEASQGGSLRWEVSPLPAASALEPVTRARRDGLAPPAGGAPPDSRHAPEAERGRPPDER